MRDFKGLRPAAPGVARAAARARAQDRRGAGGADRGVLRRPHRRRPFRRRGLERAAAADSGLEDARRRASRRRAGHRQVRAAEHGPWPAHEASALARFREILGAGLVRDLQSSVRLLVKDRGFTATTILTLAVCLGANAAIFTVVYSVLLRPLPVPESDRIVAMGDVYPTITPNDILSNTVPVVFRSA